MAAAGTPHLDREKDVKAFYDSKGKIKALVDAGITHVPAVFHLPEDAVVGISEAASSEKTHLQIPVIDLQNLGDRFDEIVDGILRASESWGLFQVVNHGVPQRVMDEMIEGARRFHEQPTERKLQIYSRDPAARVKFYSNIGLSKVRSAGWRDTLFCSMSPQRLPPEELPAVCREIMLEYTKHVEKLGQTLFELLSQALGLQKTHLKELECAKGHLLVAQYYPPCPQPDLALGNTKHSDPDFLTILLQDQVGGLQVLHQNQWVDVPPIEGALVVNMGDLLEIVSNGKFISVEHRVLANLASPRVSVASLFSSYHHATERVYAPIDELVSEHRPPIYKGTLLHDYLKFFYANGFGETRVLDYYRL